MFEITLSPVASNRTTQISASGFELTYDGQAFDFSALDNGQEVEAQAPAQGVIKRITDVIHITLVYEYDSSTAKPDQTSMQLTHTLNNATLASPVDLVEIEEPAPEAE